MSSYCYTIKNTSSVTKQVKIKDNKTATWFDSASCSGSSTSGTEKTVASGDTISVRYSSNPVTIEHRKNGTKNSFSSSRFSSTTATNEIS